jgi:hypothetical protein
MEGEGAEEATNQTRTRRALSSFAVRPPCLELELSVPLEFVCRGTPPPRHFSLVFLSPQVAFKVLLPARASVSPARVRCPFVSAALRCRPPLPLGPLKVTQSMLGRWPQREHK